MIRSKCGVSVDELGDHYTLLGPYKEQSARTEVELGELASGSPLRETVEKLRGFGWKVGGEY